MIPMRTHGWSMALSSLMILAGLGAIIIPLVAGLAVTLVTGWFLIFSGVIHLLYCWHRRHRVGNLGRNRMSDRGDAPPC